MEAGFGLDAEGLLYHQDEREDHGGGAYHCCSDENGFGGGLEGIAGSVVGLKVVLGFLKVGLETILAFYLGSDFLLVVFNKGKLID